MLTISSTSESSLKVSKSAKVSLKCFQGSFAAIADTPFLMGELPACLQASDLPGLLIDISGDSRWTSLASWTVKLINKCLTEGTRHVCGMVRPSFVYDVCCLLSHRDDFLQMVGLRF